AGALGTPEGIVMLRIITPHGLLHGLLLGLLLVSFNASAAGLTGLWVGYYSYADNHRVPMSVAIQSDGQQFIGQMIEPNTSKNPSDVGRPAIIFGTINGTAVMFDKAYFSDVESTNPVILKDDAKRVRYQLQTADNGRTLFGRWSVGGMSGRATFKRLSANIVDKLP
ncbi:MAG: hypothetical protein ACPH5V_09950, partial [Alcanivorax sp.]